MHSGIGSCESVETTYSTYVVRYAQIGPSLDAVVGARSGTGGKAGSLPAALGYMTACITSCCLHTIGTSLSLQQAC